MWLIIYETDYETDFMSLNIPVALKLFWCILLSLQTYLSVHMDTWLVFFLIKPVV